MRYSRKGFTLIELLVVIAIIALLSTLAIVALNSARQKSRDAKRISDIKQVQTALELYHADHAAYPTQDPAITMGPGGAAAMLDTAGLHATAAVSPPAYMGQIPSDPINTGANIYQYRCAGPSCQSYNVTFVLEEDTGNLRDTNANGDPECTATPDGISCI